MNQEVRQESANHCNSSPFRSVTSVPSRPSEGILARGAGYLNLALILCVITIFIYFYMYI